MSDGLWVIGRSHHLSLITHHRAVYRDYRAEPLPSRSPAGRFHAGPGTVTYLAANPATAWKEVTERWGADPKSYWIAEVEVKLASVADLTDPKTQAHYDVDERVLTSVDHRPCQRLAEQPRSDGFEAAWTYSRADSPHGRELVVFLDDLRSGSSVRVVKVAPVRDALLEL